MQGTAPPAKRLIDAESRVEALARQHGLWLLETLKPKYGELADDLAQEALLKAAAHEEAVEILHYKAFLLKVAENLAIDRARRGRRERTHASDTAALEPRSSPATQEDLVLVKQIVLALPQQLRDVLILTKVKGLSYRDVAQLKGMKVRTVKDQVRQALAITQSLRDKASA
ncbi:RNA polymerase sigma factor [Caulobacter sp.]|uniref:RNA polymerase sigma factor n=1 Tax=Caulobacter sp. TaxID=78 RepID=UPI0031E1CA9B